MVLNMSDKKTSAIAADVEKLTHNGNYYLQQGDLPQAKTSFQGAFESCRNLGDSVMLRSCALNLGAVCIALHEASKGIEILQKAIPPQQQRDGKSNGDLYFNFGLGYEMLKKDSEAVKYYELALEEYRFEGGNLHMEADVSHRAGMAYEKLNSPLQAARLYKIAATSYGRLPDVYHQASSLCKEAVQLVQCQKFEEAIQAGDNCMMLCQMIQSLEGQGKLYNELGLVFTQCHDFPKAAACFELALPIIRSTTTDKRREAIVLQNLGAVYSSLGDYQRAISFHETAAALHAQTGNRGSQGQCFTNLAFAYSQLGDTDTAGECYLHAAQAAKDAGDKKGRWQAMEGLGAVSFTQGNIDKAVLYFKLALKILADSGESNVGAQERLVAKLTDALQCQLTVQQKPVLSPKQSGGLPPLQGANYQSVMPAHRPVLQVNDMPRPPTREEQRQMHKIRSQIMLKKVPNELGHIARGFGEYETDDDLSLASSNVKAKGQGANKLEKARTDQTDYRQDTAPSKQSKSSKGHAESTEEGAATPPQLISTRRESKKSNLVSGLDSSEINRQRRDKKGLLRTNTHDSRHEWQKEVKGRELSSSDSFHERLHPPDSDDEVSESERLRKEDKIKDILKGKQASVQAGEIYNENDIALPGPSAVGPMTSKLVTPGKMVEESVEETSSSAEGSTAQATGVEGDSMIDSRGSPEDMSTNENLLRYQNRIRRKSIRDEEESDAEITSESQMYDGVDSEAMATEMSGTPAPPNSDTESSTESESDTESSEKKIPPPAPSQSPPQTLRFMNTYEDPIPVKKEDVSSEDERAHYGANYFKPDVSHSENKKEKPMKTTVTSEDPLYQTIRSLQGTEPSTSYPSVLIMDQNGNQKPPSLPPRPVNIDGMSRAEQEEFLKHLHYERSKSKDEDLQLPQKKKERRTKSQMCSVM